MPAPVGVPTGLKLEVEFTDAVWTDVSTGTDVELLFAQMQIHYGRTSPFAQPGPGSMSCTLKNPLGRYTPGRQVLTDGVTPHPFWPNVLPRKRIRYSWTVGGVTYYRFFGYVKGFPPSLYSGVLPVVPIEAADRMGQLSRVTMRSPIREQLTELAAADDILWWPLDDAAGSSQAQQNPASGPYPLGVNPAGAALTFGDNGPGVGDGTGVKFAPSSSSAGQILQGSFTPSGHGRATDTFTIEVWVNAGTSLPAWATAGNENILAAYGGTGNLQALLYLNSGIPAVTDSAATVNASASIVDGGWHHIAVIRTGSGPYQLELFVDGMSAGTAAGARSEVPGSVVVGDGGAAVTAARFQGNVGQIVIWGASNAATMAAHFAATNGYAGDLTDARIARYLGVAGLTASDWTLGAGQTTVGTYPQAGKDIVSACQDMATTEGGGAAFWVRPSDGDVRFANRRFRDAATPVLILDASVPALLDPDVWDPAFDETTLVNTSTVSRSAESGTLSTQTYTDTVSAALPPTGFGESDADVTTYTLSDQDALNLAQAQVAGNAYPAFRLNQLAVNFH